MPDRAEGEVPRAKAEQVVRGDREELPPSGIQMEPRERPEQTEQQEWTGLTDNRGPDRRY